MTDHEAQILRLELVAALAERGIAFSAYANTTTIEISWHRFIVVIPGSIGRIEAYPDTTDENIFVCRDVSELIDMLDRLS